MSKRCIILLLLVSIYSLDTKAQEHPVSGAAAYEIANEYDHRTLEFWFTGQDYIYKYKQQADIRETPAFRNKKYSGPQDSLEDIKNITALNERIKMTPLQYWYGKLGSDATCPAKRHPAHTATLPIQRGMYPPSPFP